MTDSSLISKTGNIANVLLHDGVGYDDYLEQITYLRGIRPTNHVFYLKE